MFSGGEDVVRALCKVPPKNPSGAQFASSGNDGIIRLWTLEGAQVAQLHGHENFVYSLAALPSGELVSSSEDRTARIWRGDQCVQTITHPAISVWAVAVCSENGDIATGASDRVVRVFTREQERIADPASLQEFESSVQESSIPQQQVGSINKENLPGPEFIQQKSGTKEGQVQMIRELNGNIVAYQWSKASQSWDKVGTVVDAAGSSGRKITHDGKDYDYVFDVDIEDGKPPIKFPYNLSQNPYEAARKWLETNELPMTYLDQTANFIITNTQGATLGQTTQTQAPGSDPWGTESRYRPGEVDAPAQSAEMKRPKALPQTQYLSITTANHKMVEKKIQELNKQLLDEGRKDLSLSPTDLTSLSGLFTQLSASSAGAKNITPAGVDVVLHIAISWPPDRRLAGLDLLRLLAVSPVLVTHTSGSGSQTVVGKLISSGVFSPDSPPNYTMMAIRTIANLFATEEGRLIADGEFEQIQPLLAEFTTSAKALSNRNLAAALATLYINYAVLCTAENADRALTLMDDLTKVINNVMDSEALYRALVGAGTLLCLGADFRSAAKEVFDFPKALEKAESVGKEPRIKNVIAEMRDALK